MATFSEREGIRPAKAVQIDSMDTPLRNGLWNACYIYYVQPLYNIHGSTHDLCRRLWVQVWIDLLHRRLDKFSQSYGVLHEDIQAYFFDCSWNEVYDLMEFISSEYEDRYFNEQFMDYCNQVLEKHKAGWRFVSGQLAKLTSELEMEEVERAISASSPLGGVREHLSSALRLLSDRDTPDYRNSIKESISAVESLCNMIAGQTNATLGKALGAISRAGVVPLHSALRQGFESLYGYTSDADGIRHALMDEPNVTYDDAKYMLVSCSSFVNYLIAKASDAGIQLGRR